MRIESNASQALPTASKQSKKVENTENGVWKEFLEQKEKAVENREAYVRNDGDASGPAIQIGGGVFTAGKWDKLIKSFDNAQDQIREEIKEEAEEAKQEAIEKAIADKASDAKEG